jgi:hypothetical protein
VLLAFAVPVKNNVLPCTTVFIDPSVLMPKLSTPFPIKTESCKADRFLISKSVAVTTLFKLPSELIAGHPEVLGQ